MKLREDLNSFGKSSKAGDYKLSLNDFIIKAAGLALRAVPEVNSSWRGDSIRRYNSVHINVAVNTSKGLLTPIVKDVDKIGLKGISMSVKEKAARAVEGKSTMEDLQSGTFTISNLGMFGISQFAAVINPPQAAILAVGTTKRVPTIIDGKVEASNILSVTLSADHRVVDGAVGAQWLQVFKDLLENPIKFLL
uniref:2-oxoacid dehydrogenase acyltransferase catalytic domain-containing protein n=1 Tax=Arcella intermedia TaxID=1963864 RepID=A0A6B2LB87_9EUKA